MFAAEIPAPFLITFITLGFTTTMGLVGWTVKNLLAVSDTVTRHDERLKTVERAVGIDS
jgi:hypothetical protein